MTTIQIDDKQLKRLMEEKIRYRVSYKVLIEGFFRLIKKLNLREEYDTVMQEIADEKRKEKGNGGERKYWKQLSKKNGASI